MAVHKVFSEEFIQTEQMPVLEEVVLVLPKMKSVDVRILDSNGMPVAAAEVNLSRTYPGWFTNLRSGRTNTAGHLRLDGLAADAISEYTVSIHDESYQALAREQVQAAGVKLRLPE